MPTVRGKSGGVGQLFFAPTKSDSARAVSQPMELAAGKNFTQNARFWVDSDVQAAEVAKAKRSRIAFNSDAYFNLLAMEPKVAQWLALGRNVQFVLNNTIYEIYEETKNADN